MAQGVCNARAFGKIAQLTQATADTISPLQLEIVRVSRIVAGLALGVGFGSILEHFPHGGAFSRSRPHNREICRGRDAMRF